MPKPVTCCVCLVRWDPADPGVSYRSIDNRWWCTNYRACKDRKQHAEDVAAMYRALDAVWDQLERDGWRL